MPVPTASNDPAHSSAFGPIESADETRQAQHSNSNDTPTDVNMNAIVAREQGATLTLMGKNFEANAMRFNGMMNQRAAESKLGGT